MATRNFNNTTTAGTLSAPVSPSDVFLTVTGFTNYPAVPFTATLDRGQAGEEIVLVTAAASGTLTVTRGYNGSAASTHTAGATVEHTAVALDFTEANAHVNATDNVHGISGGLVGDEAPQTLLDKTLISPVVEAEVTAGDALVAYVPEGAEARNLFRGMNPDGDDVFIVDSTGRATAAVATAPEHLVRKSQVDASVSVLTAADVALDARLDTAEATLAAATASVTPSTLVKRDASGNVAIDAITLTDTPTASGHAVTKAYADALGVSTATASTIARRDGSGRLAVATPSASGDAATKGYVDANFSDAGWVTLTLLSGWSGTSRIRVKNGIAYWYASVTRSSWGTDTPIVSLAVGQRPSEDAYAFGTWANQMYDIKVQSAGSVVVVPSGAAGLVIAGTWPVG